MTHSSPPASRKRSRSTGAGAHAQKRQQTASRSTRRRPPRRLLPRITVLAVTLALLVGIIAAVRAYSTSAPVRSDVATTTGASTTGRAPGALNFTLPTLAGTTFHLAAKLGHPVVLYFMATTCESCVQGRRDLAQTFLSSKIQGAEALAIDLNGTDRPADLQAFVQSAGIPASAPVQWGIDTTGAIASAYNVQALETTVVIDPHGQVAYRSDGAVPPEQLAQIVRNLA